jgi:hypothetical protein
VDSWMMVDYMMTMMTSDDRSNDDNWLNDNWLNDDERWWIVCWWIEWWRFMIDWMIMMSDDRLSDNRNDGGNEAMKWWNDK